MPPINYLFFKKPSKFWDAASQLRHQVFVQEQGVPESIEIDQLDEAACHLIALHQGEACGVMRILLDVDHAKFGRLATHPSYRKQGIATGMIRQSLRFCYLAGINTIFLNSQSYITHFYVKLGFEVKGNKFIEAGIPHIPMELRLPTEDHCELYTEDFARKIG